MIYVKLPNEGRLLVLDPDIVDFLKKGEVLPVPELGIVLGYVKDAPFVKKEIEKVRGKFSTLEIGRLLDEANKRPEVRTGRINDVASVGGEN